jgi:hypothetical protein
MSRRTASELYPKLLTFSHATAYYDSITPVRGHRDSPARPLAKGKRTICAWRILPTPDGIACMNGNHAVITYHRSGWVWITPTTFTTQDISIIRAVAPVDTVKWDYRKNCLIVRANDTTYICDARDPHGIMLPPLDPPNTSLHPLA